MGKPFLDIAIFAGNAYLNNTNDPAPGKAIASSGYTFVIPYQGILGKLVRADHAEALLLSDTVNIGTLYGGVYQYVKAVTALARGQVVAWDVLANTGFTDYEVTSTITLPHEGFLAGFALNTVTSGNYCWIQTDGLATALCKATVTTTTVGTIAVQQTTTNTVDSIADATGTYISGGALGLKQIVGAWYEAPANGALKRLVMQNFCKNY